MSLLHSGHCHTFEAGGQRFVYLSDSAAVVAMDSVSAAVMDAVATQPRSHDDLLSDLAPRFAAADIGETVGELMRVRALTTAPSPSAAPPSPAIEAKRSPRILPLTPIPVSTMVMNVTSQCNLACAYCYEYGEDKIVDTDNGRQPRWMTEDTARASVDFLLGESGPTALITFFGGETLLNFKVVRFAVDYATSRAAALGKRLDFSLTTNATLLKPDVIDFLIAHDFGVTISIDGPADVQDKFRVFQNGRGSYDLVEPNIKAFLAKRPTRPVGARVTLTRDTLDVRRIYTHLTEAIGFHEVGFAPVTSASTRAHGLGDSGFDEVLAQFRDLAADYREAALAGRHHGFSNVRETLEEIHKGANKAYPCGAGFGLLGVSTGGDIGLCHRFAGSDAHKLGTVRDGLDRDVQAAFLQTHHIDHKTDCRTCWARPLCAGGCYHEAHTRQGSTVRPNLHYCEWIRGWSATCLEIYGAIAQGNPSFLRQFEGAA
jgi:uncharacterized protein